MKKFVFNMIFFYDILAILLLLVLFSTIVAPRMQGEWMFPFMFILFPAFWLLSALIFLAGLLFPKNKHKHLFLAFLPCLVLLGVYRIPIWIQHLCDVGVGIAFFCGLFSIMLIIHIVITGVHRNYIGGNLKEGG
ncbi:MAG: hypothetical protein P9M03_03290 [Candidatus Theseobacter exili]|nr:hypothetical protein [Candidatus Theseobacter exili]